MDPLESLLRQVDNLPTLPDVHLRIVRRLDARHCELREVAEMIALDPVLSGRVIRMANSAVFGASARTDSLRDAIMRIGTRETRNLILTAAIVDVLPPRSSRLDLRVFWTLGLASALCARQLSRDLRFSGADQAYLGGLVHSLGEAILAMYFPDRFMRAVDDARLHDCRLEESIWTEFGFTHPVLCAKVLETWNFPPGLVEAVEYHLDPGEAPKEPLLASILLVSDRMCRELGFGPADPGSRYAGRSWLSDIPREIALQLCDGGYDGLDAYLDEHKEQLRDVSSLVQAIFSGH